jgi:hypothetical protein
MKITHSIKNKPKKIKKKNKKTKKNNPLKGTTSTLTQSDPTHVGHMSSGPWTQFPVGGLNKVAPKTK